MNFSLSQTLIINQRARRWRKVPRELLVREAWDSWRQAEAGQLSLSAIFMLADFEFHQFPYEQWHTTAEKRLIAFEHRLQWCVLGSVFAEMTPTHTLDTTAALCR